MAVAELLGIQVIVHRDGLPELARSCATTDGYTEPVRSRDGLRYRIHLNGTKPGLRVRFTFTHKISHAWLNHPTADPSLTNDVAEAEANSLASYLLAPYALVRAWAPGLTVAGIAATFQISPAAARLAHARVMRAATWRPGASIMTSAS